MGRGSESKEKRKERRKEVRKGDKFEARRIQEHKQIVNAAGNQLVVVDENQVHCALVATLFANMIDNDLVDLVVAELVTNRLCWDFRRQLSGRFTAMVSRRKRLSLAVFFDDLFGPQQKFYRVLYRLFSNSCQCRRLSTNIRAPDLGWSYYCACAERLFAVASIYWYLRQKFEFYYVLPAAWFFDVKLGGLKNEHEWILYLSSYESLVESRSGSVICNFAWEGTYYSKPITAHRRVMVNVSGLQQWLRKGREAKSIIVGVTESHMHVFSIAERCSLFSEANWFVSNRKN